MNADLDAAIPLPWIDPADARDCLCGHRHLETPTIVRPWCPRHDFTLGTTR